MAKPIGTLGTVTTITVGGKVFTDLTNLKILHCFTSSTGGNGTFRLNGTSVGYQAGANGFQIQAVRAFTATSGIDSSGQLLYSDNDVGFNSTTAFTNPVYSYGVAGAADLLFKTGTIFETAVNFTIPNTKYVSFAAPTATSIYSIVVYGYEL